MVKRKHLRMHCYSLDNVSILEKKLKFLKKDMGIESYLTGFSGGVRYAPVIRYNKVHMYHGTGGYSGSNRLSGDEGSE